MKKLIFIGIFIIIAGIFSASAYIKDTSPTGWYSSTGTTWLDGTAQNVQMIAGGYRFTCTGVGICFIISGNNLFIYDRLTSPPGGELEEDIEVSIYQN